jgi:methyltransferase
MSNAFIDLDLTLAQVILAAVLLERLIELWIARRNTTRLLAEGAVEHGTEYYPYLAILHGAWLAALVYFTPPGTPVDFGWLLVYLLLLLGRIWVMTSLGRFWTTRIITSAHGTPADRSPFRYLRHPNHVLAAAEIAVLPLVFGHWQIAAVFSLLNALVLRERINTENEALARRRGVD